MGVMSARLAQVGHSQDNIRWLELLHGKVSVQITAIQKMHCMHSPPMLNERSRMDEALCVAFAPHLALPMALSQLYPS